MFSHYRQAADQALSTINSGLSWILNHKKAIAIFALLMSANAVSAESNKRIILDVECGKFELKNSNEIRGIAKALKKPLVFTARFEDSVEMVSCFTDELGSAFCAPPRITKPKRIF